MLLLSQESSHILHLKTEALNIEGLTAKEKKGLKWAGYVTLLFIALSRLPSE